MARPLRALLLSVVLLASFSAAGAQTPRQPNLQALPASDLRVEPAPDGRVLLRFSTTSKNVGLGPLELVAGAAHGNSQRVYQRVYVDGGEPILYLAGDFEYHPLHNHFHFNDYANYVLQPVDAPGASQRIGSKTTFCVMDTTRIDAKLPGAPRQPQYATCGAQIQGMSVGWGDTYGSQLAGQELDITGLPDGVYDLRIQIDPKKRIVETADSDNESSVQIRLQNGSVCPASGRRCR